LFLLNIEKGFDFMSPRGGWRGGGRPPKEEGQLREHFGCRIKAANLTWLQETRERTVLSAGEIVDLAIELLQAHPEELPPSHLAPELDSPDTLPDYPEKLSPEANQ
jgi:hypothetical protein